MEIKDLKIKSFLDVQAIFGLKHRGRNDHRVLLLLSCYRLRQHKSQDKQLYIVRSSGNATQ